MTRVAEAAFTHFSDEQIPARLKMGKFRVVNATLKSSRIRTYSRSEPLDLPHELLAVLAHFDGRANEHVIAEVEDEEQVTLTPELLRTLVDFSVLVPAESLARENRTQQTQNPRAALSPVTNSGSPDHSVRRTGT